MHEPAKTSTSRHERAISGNLLVKQERFDWILDRLKRDGRVLAADLTNDLGVSEDTIRRDLRELAAARRVQRVHGGALPPATGALDYAARARHSVPQKRSIGQAAAKLIPDGALVFLDGGTTNVHVAESLRPDLKATVITNSIPIAAVLADHASVQVILIGGKLLGPSRVTTGPEAVDAVRSYRADLFLLGTCSIDVNAGITVPHLEEAPIKRAMIASASRVVGLVTAEKFGTAMGCVAGSLDDLDAIVTEYGAGDALIAPYLQAGIEVIRGEETI